MRFYLHKCEEALSGKQVHEKTFRKLLSLEEKLSPAIERCDRLLTLYHWILDQMEDTAGITDKLRKVLAKTRRNLSNVLIYLERAEKALRKYAVKKRYPEESFVLMYRIQGYHPSSQEYRSADRRFRHILKKKYEDAYLETERILKGVKHASSLWKA